jgi:hypothetical protein
MKLTHYAELGWTTRGTARSPGAPDGSAGRPRPATQVKLLQRGEAGRPGYFEMTVSRYPEAKDYKRHRHIIDQIRLTLAGSSPWEPDRATATGDLLYVPAHTYYGPYVRPAGVELLAVQFAAGPDQPFEENSVDPATDTGRAPTRFTVPIEVRPAGFPWVPVAPGVRVKEFARFGSGGTALSMLSVSAGGSRDIPTGQRTLLFVTKGTGRIGGNDVSERDGLFLAAGERADAGSEDELELLVIELASG